MLRQSPLKQHFSKFGAVARVFVSPANEKALITFEDHQSAK
jgi:hypothetical protein